ncbi:MAG: hypothetical protein PHV74_04140 [Dehalococcoidia bacterium]|nr:hypothetical protein [Dehalococcoidia bacterium]
MKKLIYLILVLALALSVSGLAACGGDDEDNGDTPQATQQGEPTATKTEAAAATTPTATKTTTATQKPSGDSSELGDVVSMDELKSYKMHMVMSSPMGGGDITTDMEVVNDPPPKATHTVMDMGMGTTEIITIGNTTWTKMMGMGWMESTTEESSVQEPTDIADYIDMDSDVNYQGKEKVNGVNCKHYEVETNMTVDTSSFQEGVSGEVTASFKGEVWVADESGMPKVMIRQVGTTEMEMPAPIGKISMDMATDITEINGAFTISPPPADEITQMPDMGDFTPPEGLDDFEMPCPDFELGSPEWLDCMGMGG